MEKTSALPNSTDGHQLRAIYVHIMQPGFVIFHIDSQVHRVAKKRPTFDLL